MRKVIGLAIAALLMGTFLFVPPMALVLAPVQQTRLAPELAEANSNQDPQLNLSHVDCVEGKLEVHFVVVHYNQGDELGVLKYVSNIGSRFVSSEKQVGKVAHFTDRFDFTGGLFTIDYAEVVVNGSLVTLHNPYSGTFNCVPSPTFTVVVPTATSTKTPEVTNTATNTSIPTVSNSATPTNTSTGTAIVPTGSPLPSNTPSPTVAATQTPTEEETQTKTPMPTETPTWTLTPVSSETVVPTATSEPTGIPSEVPPSNPTSTPTDNEPAPTTTVIPTETPTQPTPEPTEPTAMPTQTETPVPTQTPTEPPVQPTPVSTSEPTEVPVESIPQPVTSVSDGHLEYPGNYAGRVRMANGMWTNMYEAAFDENGTPIVPDKGYAYWSGNIYGHLEQQWGWTLLPRGGEFVWYRLDGSVLRFEIGGSRKKEGYDGKVYAMPSGRYQIVTCYIDWAKSTPEKIVYGGNLIAELKVK